ncbi:MAG: flagellar motor switch phosphatase FliY [Clostridiales bacterium]|jgi:flagellar motor switch protein FliN/FliY|nr:flagellar motor switch phosphatase FliY [Clostridiales bacterium]
MGDMLSQAELDALLGNVMEDLGDSLPSVDGLSAEDQDVLGEIGNINMGTAATTLFTLLSQKVLITTPHVNVMTWRELSSSYDRPAVGIRVGYKVGLRGSNILILKDRDVKIIADLMMGGTGDIEGEVELNDLDMSAIGEAMNQMVGSASTSLSSMIKQKVDIDTPHPFMLEFTPEGTVIESAGFTADETIVSIAFRMEIGDLIDSEIMQIYPMDFAKELVVMLKDQMMGESGGSVVAQAPAPVAAPPTPAPVAPPPAPVPVAPPPPPVAQAPVYAQPAPQPMYAQPQPVYAQTAPLPQNVQTAQFVPFDPQEIYQQKENMGIIMDVPLEISVELGRTYKKISEILEFSPGTVLELDKLAGEPIDIIVNGKFVAKGDVVVIDENFGIRITEIISADKRI